MRTNEGKNVFMKDVKKILMLFLLTVMLWLSIARLPQTYADPINNMGVDNIYDEIDISYESDKVDTYELDNYDEIDISYELDKVDTYELDNYDDAELEHESYQDFDLNDDSSDEQVLEDYQDDINDDVDIDTLSLERNTFIATNTAQLQAHINSAPTNGTIRTIQIQTFRLVAPTPPTQTTILEPPIIISGNRRIRLTSVPDLPQQTLHLHHHHSGTILAGTPGIRVQNTAQLEIDNLTLCGNGANINSVFVQLGHGNATGTNANIRFTMNDNAIMENVLNAALSVNDAANARFYIEMNSNAVIRNSATVTSFAAMNAIIQGNTSVNITMNDSSSITNNGGGISLTRNNTARAVVEMNDDATISGNHSLLTTDFGAGVRMLGTSNEPVIITMNNNATISENVAPNGGGIGIGGNASATGTAATITMNNNASIRGNIATGLGNHGTVQQGSSGGGGGIAVSRMSISNNPVNITMNGNASITENIARLGSGGERGNGGGIHIDNFTNVTLNGNARISDNIAEANGGGISVARRSGATITANVTINGNSGISNNEATGAGGGLYINNHGPANVTLSGEISRNRAANGGGIAVFNGSLNMLAGASVIENHAFESDNNTTGIGGGGIFWANRSSLSNVTIARGAHVESNTFAEAGVERTNSVPLFDNPLGGAFRTNINPGPWSGANDSHAFNAADIRIESFLVGINLQYNFEESPGNGQFKRLEGSEQFRSDTRLTADIWNTYIENTMNRPTREGYNFDGWAFTPDGAVITPDTLNNHPFNFGADRLPDMNLYAQWTPMPEVTISFMWNYAGNADAFDTVTIPQGQSIENTLSATMPTDPIRVGYTFIGWSVILNDFTPFDPETVINYDMNVYAWWSRIPIRTLTFELNGGVISDTTGNLTREMLDGQSVLTSTVNPPINNTMPAEPVNLGYIFNGWQVTSSDATGIAVGTVFTSSNLSTRIIVGGDVTVSATWRPIQSHPTWLLISVPREVMFQSGGIDGFDHEELVSSRFNIRNRSGRGVDISVVDFQYNANSDSMSDINTLNLVPQPPTDYITVFPEGGPGLPYTFGVVTSSEVPLITATDTIPFPEVGSAPFMTISRSPQQGMANYTPAWFTFSGTSELIDDDLGALRPTFRLVLGFRVNALY